MKRAFLLRFGACLPLAAGLSTLAALAPLGACSSSGSDSRTFGPTFEGGTSDPGAREAGANEAGGGGGGGGGGGEDGGPEEDGATPAGDGGSCAGAIALLAGAPGALVGATWSSATGWVSAPVNGGAANDVPAVVSVAGGFLGVTRGANDALLAVGAQPTFGVPGPVAAATARSAPALVAAGNAARVVHQGADYKHAHVGWQGGAFGALQPVGTAADPSYGPSAPAAALLATGDVAVAWNGDGTADQGKLLVRTLSGATWSATAALDGSLTLPDAGPALVSLAGPRDLVVVWVDKTTRYLTVASRDAQSKAWSAGAPIAPPAALPATNEAPHLAAVGGSKVVLVWRGTDDKPYLARGDVAAAGVTFAPPEAVVPGTNPVVLSAPVVSTAPCGEHALVAYARASGVEVVRLEAQGAKAPEAIGATAGARFVGLAARP